MITDIEDFFSKGCGRCDRFDTPDCSTRLWADGLRKLREICLSAGLEETVKWGQACYMHAGRNIAIMGAYQNKFVFGFFNAALMKDPDGVLEKPGPNTQHANTMNFTANQQVAMMEGTIRAYLWSAVVEKAGTAHEDRPYRPSGTGPAPHSGPHGRDLDARTGGRRQRTDLQTAVGESGMPQQEPEDLATGVSARPCNRD